MDLENFINLPYFINLKLDDYEQIPASMLFQDDDLRFFQNAEIFEGYKRIELIKDTQKIQRIMETLNN